MQSDNTAPQSLTSGASVSGRPTVPVMGKASVSVPRIFKLKSRQTETTYSPSLLWAQGEQKLEKMCFLISSWIQNARGSVCRADVSPADIQLSSQEQRFHLITRSEKAGGQTADLSRSLLKSTRSLDMPVSINTEHGNSSQLSQTYW